VGDVGLGRAGVVQEQAVGAGMRRVLRGSPPARRR